MKRNYQATQMGAYGPLDRSRHDDFMPSPYSMSSSNKGKQLMSFQNYVRTLTNSVDETTAYNKYKEFMANLSQSKVGRFFDANKEREWFRIKYHPVESQKTLNRRDIFFKKRLKIFNDLNDKNYFDTLSYSVANSSAILNLMDAITIQLEDGPEALVNQLLSRDDTKIDFNLKNDYIPLEPTSVVIDDINIDATLAEIQDLCTQANSNLVRIAQLDPYYVVGGHLKQKVVAIYKNTVDIKDVCWRLSRLKLHGKPLSVRINRCLTKRIYPVDVASNHHVSVLNDIRNAILLVLNFDKMRGFDEKKKRDQENIIPQESIKMEVDSFESNNGDTLGDVAPPSPPGSNKSDDDEGKAFDFNTLDEEREKDRKKLLEFKFNLDLGTYRIARKLQKSKNTILQGAYNYLIDFVEASQFQYQLSKIAKELQAEPEDINYDKLDDDKFLKLELVAKSLPYSLEENTRFLDKILWYLRIVHSFDYYKKLIYHQEDELTLKMSAIHLRDDVSDVPTEISKDTVKSYLQKNDCDLNQFLSQAQKYVTKDEERFNYKSYGKVIADELTSYAQRITKPKSSETEEVYKCKHCARIFQKLTDIGRHFVTKHRWATDAIELETDFFNAYLFDWTKIDPCPPKHLIEVPTNRFARASNFSQSGEDPDPLQQTIEAYNKLESFVREPAPRARVESDPRNESIVDYADVSFDDAI